MSAYRVYTLVGGTDISFSAAEPDLPSKPSRKRGAPDDDEPFERIVKRMIVSFSVVFRVYDSLIILQVDASKTVGSPSSQIFTAQGSPTTALTVSPLVVPSVPHTVPAQVESPFNWMEPGRDIFAPGMLFRDEGVFSGSHFDETTMVELSELLYSNPYRFNDGAGGLH